MKTKKNILLLFGTVIFVSLIYHQEPGINVSIFAMLIWLSLFLLKEHLLRDKKFILLSIAVFISIISYAWYGDFSSFWAVFISMSVTGFYVMIGQKIKPILQPVIIFANYLTSPVRVFFLNFWLINNENKKKNILPKIIALFIIPAFFVIMFIIVYVNASNHLADFVAKFKFDFDVFEIFFLAVLGFFLLFSFYHIFIPDLVKNNQSFLNNHFSEQQKNVLPTFPGIHINLERKSGVITLLLLNILLLFFLVIYNVEHFTGGASGQLSADVHERIYVVIFSIVMAVAVIMFYFKGSFNFDSKNQQLKTLAFCWIGLNTLLIFSASLSNVEYVSKLGLTFKRIGVFIFLMLCLIGLYFTFQKIIQQKTNYYLIEKMMITFFVTLVIGSAVNWSWIATKYNITYIKNSPSDIRYMYHEYKYNKALFYKHFKDFEIYNYTDDYTVSPLKKRFYGEEIKEEIQREKSRELLSQNLYFTFLKIE